MKPILLTALLLLSGGLRAGTPGSDADPAARALLAEVVARLPPEPLAVSGELTVRRHKGVLVHAYAFDMTLRWGADPPRAQYTIRANTGATLEQLTIVRPPGGDARLSYAAGSPLTEQPLPPLTDKVQQTDLTWLDLSLSFLWWPEARLAGRDSVRGRDCQVVEVDAPARLDADRAYALARLWIDEELRMLLQAEACDAEGRALRRLWVKSIKKVDGRWMIKDMEVQQLPAAHRTRLRVLDVGAAPQP